MKAITLWQSWASLVAIGAKPYEFRGWLPPKSIVGKRIAIHAAARPVSRLEVIDLIRRLEEDDRALNPCLHRDIALPFLQRVLAGIPDKRKAKSVPLFQSEVSQDGVEPYVCPLSAVLCTAVLGEPKRGDICAQEFGRDQGLYVPAMAGSAFNWGWPMLHVEPVFPPIPVRGAQGFWNWRDSAYSRGGAAA